MGCPSSLMDLSLPMPDDSRACRAVLLRVSSLPIVPGSLTPLVFPLYNCLHEQAFKRGTGSLNIPYSARVDYRCSAQYAGNGRAIRVLALRLSLLKLLRLLKTCATTPIIVLSLA